MTKPLILVIEDDETISYSLKSFFESKGYAALCEATFAGGLETALREIPDTIVLDLRLPDGYGIDFLKEIKNSYPEISVIMMTGYAEIGEAVKAMKLGAEYYFQKPIDLDELGVIVEKGLGIKQMRQAAALYRESPYPIVGRSMQTQGLIHMINLLASNPSTTVLIQGETGTGKELVARNIHARSDRKDKPFVDINCAAIPENIVESELFGYESGAFTDAKKTKKGMFELADGGTVFLDEIGDMAGQTQAKLLRVLESRAFRRLGGTRDISVDLRVIAATNRDLEDLVKKGAFREDLYYRLNVMPLGILPLRKRPEDIPLIAEFLLSEIRNAIGKKEIRGFAEDAMDLLCAYPWPGNVRELRNVIERAALLCPGGDIACPHLVLPRQDGSVNACLMTLREVEEDHIKKIISLAGGNKTRASRILGVARSTLNEKLKLLDLNIPG